MRNRVFILALAAVALWVFAGALPATASTISFDWSTGGTGTTVFNNWADRSYGGLSILYADKKDKFDGSKKYGETQFLLSFDNLFGTDPGEIPLGSTINSATIRFYEYSGSGDTIDVYTMTSAWDGTSTWNTLGGGITPGGNAQATPSSSYQHNNPYGFFGIDVASSLQAWADGQVNLGWGFIDQGNDGVDYASFNNFNLAKRPTLTVDYTVVPPGDAPEPGTLLLLGSSMVGVWGWRRRRRKRRQQDS